MKHLESGRSMVEMLGVLAVMGIISIGGLYGYTYAMKRHRANELLNEANKRAVMVASQLMTGKDPEDVNIDEFPTKTPYGTFNAKIEPEGTDKSKMTINDLDEETCNLLKNLAGGSIRRVSCEETGSSFTAEMFFNNDLSTEERASDFTTPETCKSPYKWCSGSETCTSDESCTCSGIKPVCKVCDTTTGGYSIDEEDDTLCKTNSTLTEEDGTCQSGECVKTPTINCDDYPGSGLEDGQVYVGGIAGFASDNETICRCPAGKGFNGANCDLTCLSSGTCLNNEGLCPGYYCKATTATDGSTCYTAQGNITALPMIIPTIDVNGYTYYTSGGYTYLGTNNNGNVYYSTNGTTMSWDGAYYYCEAVGTKLGKSVGLAWPKKSNGTDCPESQNCPNWPSAIYWLNKSERVENTRTIMGREVTTYSVGNTLAKPSDDFCYTYAISNGSVRHGMLRRQDGYYYALCE